MLRKSEGFTLLETFVSFNIWILLIIGLLPQLIHIGMERHNVILMSTANEILHEELYRYVNEGHLVKTSTEKIINSKYSVSLKMIDDKMVKICVSWKDSMNREKMKCGYGKG